MLSRISAYSALRGMKRKEVTVLIAFTMVMSSSFLAVGLVPEDTLSGPQDPYLIYGYVYQYGEPSPLMNCNVTVRWWNVSSNSWSLESTVSNVSGIYSVDLLNYSDGGIVHCNVTYNPIYGDPGYNSTTIDLIGSPGGRQVDIICGEGPQPSVVVDKWAPATACQGEIITYWINYSNQGDDWAYNTIITETYPLGTTFISAIPAPDIGAEVWSLGALAPNVTGSIQITVMVDPSVPVGTWLVNNVTVDYQNATGTPFQDWAEVSTLVVGLMMTIDKTAPAIANPGETIIYTITYQNIGIDTAYNVMITETYPPGVTFVDANPAPTVADNIWFVGDFLPGQGGSIFINVTILAANGTLINWVNLDYEDGVGAPLPPCIRLARVQ